MSRLLSVCGVLGLVALVVVPLASAPAPAAKVPKELLEARLDAASRAYIMLERRTLELGYGAPSDLFGWSRRWLDAELPLCQSDKSRLKAYREHVLRTREEERRASRYAKLGTMSPAHAEAARYYRIDAEILLLQAGGELPKASEKSARICNRGKGPDRKRSPKSKGGDEPLTPPKEVKDKSLRKPKVAEKGNP